MSRVVLMGIATEFPSESRLIRMFALKRALVRAMRLFRMSSESLKQAHLRGDMTFGQVVRAVATEMQESQAPTSTKAADLVGSQDKKKN